MKGKEIVFMTSIPPDNTEIKGGGAAAKKTYSPEELAEVYKTSRPVFLIIDLEEVTLNWNQNYIFSFLKCVGDLPMIDDIIEWMVGVWEDQNGLYNTYDNNVMLAQSDAVFTATLKSIRGSVAEWLEKKARLQKLREKMLSGYLTDTTTIEPQEIVTEKTQTQEPTFQPPSHHAQAIAETKYCIRLEDLPEDIRKKVLVSQQVLDVFVHQLNEDLWLTVQTNKTKLCGCLFFLCNFHYVTSRNMDAKEFALLLSHVVVALKGKGSVESSIRRRSETKESTIEQSYKYYAGADVSKDMEKKIFKLRNDCEELTDGFQPVLDAMKAEEEAAKAAAQASSAA